MKHSVQELNDIAKEARRVTMKCIASLGKGHVGGALDIVDALTVLYYEEMNIDPANPKMAGRDRLVLSKGHGGPGLYAILALKGFFDMKEIYTLNKPGTMLPSHCDRLLTPGIDMTTGSLGQGLSAAVGMALADRIDGNGARVYCIIGDGESQEGQIWEAGMYAAQMKLGSLTCFLDLNGSRSTRRSTRSTPCSTQARSGARSAGTCRRSTATTCRQSTMPSKPQRRARTSPT